MQKAQALVEDYLSAHVAVIQAMTPQHYGTIEAMIDVIVDAIRAGGKLLIAGNGGSAADAQHFAAEMVGRFQMERKAIPAIALTTDTSILTAIGNDYGFDQVFVRQVEALARPGDILLGISTSGQSHNLLQAMVLARQNGCRTLCLAGKDGGAMAQSADLALVIPSMAVPHIQEAHLTVIHLMCREIERRLFMDMTS